MGLSFVQNFCVPFHEVPPHPALSPCGGEGGDPPGEGGSVHGFDVRPKLDGDVRASFLRKFLWTETFFRRKVESEIHTRLHNPKSNIC